MKMRNAYLLVDGGEAEMVEVNLGKTLTFLSLICNDQSSRRAMNYLRDYLFRGLKNPIQSIL